MREIKFRALRTDGKGWVYGSLLNTCGECEISDINCIVGSRYDVIPETVGQLHNTLTRKAGTEVYEGDKISFDLEAGLGEPKSYGHQQTISTVEGNYGFYSNVKVIGSIHTTHDKGKEESC